MIKYKLSNLLLTAAEEAQKKGTLPQIALPEITLERPQNSTFGDYASNLALKLARSARMNPMMIAKEIVEAIPPADFVEKVDIATPGFINFSLNEAWLAKQVDEILRIGSLFGSINLGNNLRVQLEFVSANPTGPLHVGHGRGAILGSALGNVLKMAGFDVEREYYINDAGNQMDAFYRTLWARYNQALGRDVPLPTDGYVGAYMIDLAKEIQSEEGDRFLSEEPEKAVWELGQIGLKKILAVLRSDLSRLGVEFDVWFSERSLFENSQFEKAMSSLKEKGYTNEKEGATWFTSTALGEDKDNVLIRSNGSPTYFASDVAYHYNKFGERKFDRVIDIWGADHMGHVSRMKAVISALGFDPAKLDILISQMVTLKRGNEIIRLSKRTGEIITLDEVIDEVGADACRFFFLARSADSQMDFDLELAKEQSSENPVYYVQYAHARIASIVRLAEERGIDFSDGDVSLLTSEPELDLIRQMLRLPELVEIAAKNLEPHHLPHYAQELAGVFHVFYKQCRVVSEDEQLSKARLKLVNAARIVLANTLAMMGMTAPEQM